MKRLSYCYLLTRALPEGGCRYYVGIRTCPLGKTPQSDTRYMGSGKRIRRAVKAHPGEFSKTIVETFDTIEEAKALERALVGLATANSPYSYNLCEGGGSGALHSEESKAKNRAATIAQYADQEAKARLLAGQSSEATRAKLRAGLRRRYADSEFKARHAATTARGNRERSLTTEWRARNAAAQRRPDVRAKHSVSGRKRFQDSAERAKSSAAQRRLCASLTPEERHLRAAHLSAPDVVDRRRATLKARIALLTTEQREARTAGLRRANERRHAEAQRRKREVGLIFFALVNHYYGGEQAA